MQLFGVIVFEGSSEDLSYLMLLEIAFWFIANLCQCLKISFQCIPRIWLWK